MKKKLSIIPLLVVALTMMFGTLCVWAADPTSITKVVINLPETCDGRKVEDFIESDITVAVYVSDDSPTSIDIKPLKYKDVYDVQSYIETTDRGILNRGTTMEKGKGMSLIYV